MIPNGLIELTLPDRTDVAGVVDALREASPMLDPRACLATVGGAQVPPDRPLKDGEEVGLYPAFRGGDRFRERACGDEKLVAMLKRMRG